MQLFKVFDHRR